MGVSAGFVTSSKGLSSCLVQGSKHLPNLQLMRINAAGRMQDLALQCKALQTSHNDLLQPRPQHSNLDCLQSASTGASRAFGVILLGSCLVSGKEPIHPCEVPPNARPGRLWVCIMHIVSVHLSLCSRRSWGAPMGLRPAISGMPLPVADCHIRPARKQTLPWPHTVRVKPAALARQAGSATSSSVHERLDLTVQGLCAARAGLHSRWRRW
jgi:hypothetical protein